MKTDIKQLNHLSRLLGSVVLTVAWHSRRLWRQDGVMPARKPRRPALIPKVRSSGLDEERAPQPLLSVIIPCYNEAATIPDILAYVRAVTLDKEIIAVDDHSSDETLAVLQREAIRDPRMRVIHHPHNRGKGAAVRSGLAHARGQIVIIQDADLEYDPNDYYELVRPIADGRVNVVFGSRFMGQHTGMYFWNALGNKGLTFLTNFLFNCWISDMETCYKAMRTDIMRSLDLESDDFRIEPEITAKVLRQGHRIYEVPVSYMGRTYEEGKKMKPIQGFYAVLGLLRYRRWEMQPFCNGVRKER